MEAASFHIAVSGEVHGEEASLPESTSAAVVVAVVVGAVNVAATAAVAVTIVAVAEALETEALLDSPK